MGWRLGPRRAVRGDLGGGVGGTWLAGGDVPTPLEDEVEKGDDEEDERDEAGGRWTGLGRYWLGRIHDGAAFETSVNSPVWRARDASIELSGLMRLSSMDSSCIVRCARGDLAVSSMDNSCIVRCICGDRV